MEVRAEEYKESLHYPLLATWWLGHGWPVPGPKSLSSSGLIVRVDNNPVLAGWVYQTNSDIYLLEFIISDPSSSKIERREALSLLVSQASSLAKSRGAKYLFMSTAHKNLIKNLKEVGFFVTDENVTNLLRYL